jgi:hypothetical protein
MALFTSHQEAAHPALRSNANVVTHAVVHNNWNGTVLRLSEHCTACQAPQLAQHAALVQMNDMSQNNKKITKFKLQLS